MLQHIEKSVDKRIAESLYIKDFTRENLKTKLNSLLTNPQYGVNIQITSKAFKDQKETPLERAVWWIEWAIRNPNVSYFKGNEQNLNFLQVESADVYITLTIIFYTFSIIFLWISIKLYNISKSKESLKLTVSKNKKKKQK